MQVLTGNWALDGLNFPRNYLDSLDACGEDALDAVHRAFSALYFDLSVVLQQARFKPGVVLDPNLVRREPRHVQTYQIHNVDDNTYEEDRPRMIVSSKDEENALRMAILRVRVWIHSVANTCTHIPTYCRTSSCVCTETFF